jgi:hypothetical protein
MSGFDVIGKGIASVTDGLMSTAGQSVLVVGLAMLFIWSGAAKLLRPARAAAALRDFGLLTRATPAAGRLAGAVELVLAALLAVCVEVGALITPAAVIAALMFVGFAVLQASSLLRGRRFACFCFGDDTVELSWSSVARSLALAAVAGLVLLERPALDGQPTATVATELAIAAAGLSTISLLALWPRLKRWQTDPFRLRDELWIQRSPL